MKLHTDVSFSMKRCKFKLSVGIYRQTTSSNMGIHTNQVRSSTMGVDTYHVWHSVNGAGRACQLSCRGRMMLPKSR